MLTQPLPANETRTTDATAAASSAEHPVDSTVEVLRRAHAGEQAALWTLLERTLGPLRRWAGGRLPRYAREYANTEDVVQDVAVRAFGGLRRFKFRTLDDVRAYLRESVRNRIRDEIRKVMRRGSMEPLPAQVAEDRMSPLELVILNEDTERYMRALRQLKPAQRLLLVHRLEHRRSFDEIARLTNKPTANAARVAVGRAMDRLAEILAAPPAGPLTH